MFIKYNRHLPEFRIVGKDRLSKILLANCKTEHDSELQLLASKLDFLIRQQ